MVMNSLQWTGGILENKASFEIKTLAMSNQSSNKVFTIEEFGDIKLPLRLEHEVSQSNFV